MYERGYPVQRQSLPENDCFFGLKVSGPDCCTRDRVRLKPRINVCVMMLHDYLNNVLFYVSVSSFMF